MTPILLREQCELIMIMGMKPQQAEYSRHIVDI